MKMPFSWCAVSALLLLMSGCARFEEPPPKHEERSASVKRRESKEPKARENRRRDPVDDMFFGVGKRAEAPSFATEGLNEEERSIVDGELRRQNDEMKALRRKHRDFDSARDKRQEWIYGFRPRDLR